MRTIYIDKEIDVKISKFESFITTPSDLSERTESHEFIKNHIQD